MKKTLAKIGSLALDVVIILVFVVSAMLVVANLTVDKEKGEQPNIFGYVISSVQSDSMSGTFEKGALVIGKIPGEDTTIAVGDIISFRQRVGGVEIINTHRVVAIDESGSAPIYQTQGDNKVVCPDPDTEWKSMADITAVYHLHLPGVGGFIDFLKKPVGFILVLVIPMLAFIAWQVYKLITIYLAAKKEQMLEEAKEGVSDEAKDAIIREYLAKMQAQSGAQGAEQSSAQSAEQSSEQSSDSDTDDKKE